VGAVRAAAVGAPRVLPAWPGITTTRATSGHSTARHSPQRTNLALVLQRQGALRRSVSSHPPLTPLIAGVVPAQPQLRHPRSRQWLYPQSNRLQPLPLDPPACQVWCHRQSQPPWHQRLHQSHRPLQPRLQPRLLAPPARRLHCHPLGQPPRHLLLPPANPRSFQPRALGPRSVAVDAWPALQSV
jgi:hypothetical protein